MPRIAIVDDSRLVRAFTAGALRAKGHETVEVEPTSLFEVLKVLRETPVDLLVADFLMPILVVSAHRDDISLQRMQQMGISGFLLKPVDAPTLVAKVAEALEG